jgi:hypothetical protein
MLVGAAIAAATEFVVVRPLRNAPRIQVLVGTLAVGALPAPGCGPDGLTTSTDLPTPNENSTTRVLTLISRFNYRGRRVCVHLGCL